MCCVLNIRTLTFGARIPLEGCANYVRYFWAGIVQFRGRTSCRLSPGKENFTSVRKCQTFRTFILSSIPTRCNVIQYSLLLSMLYMFQAVSPPIIRSSKTVHTTSGICQVCLLLTLAPDDGRRNRLKHVEH
jgi:hypothetical protein